MRRPHRRAHLILWLLIAPAAAAGLALALMNRPADPRGAIPDDIVTSEAR
ncbi:MAG: hypothetical protein R3C60_09890 [Parvularculaceae bacterium]